jgi:hypothetical protein
MNSDKGNSESVQGLILSLLCGALMGMCVGFWINMALRLREISGPIRYGIISIPFLGIAYLRIYQRQRLFSAQRFVERGWRRALFFLLFFLGWECVRELMR